MKYQGIAPLKPIPSTHKYSIKYRSMLFLLRATADNSLFFSMAATYMLVGLSPLDCEFSTFSVFLTKKKEMFSVRCSMFSFATYVS